MGDNMSDCALEHLLKKAREHQMTPKEKYEQRVSFVYGQLAFNPKRTITKEDVRRILAEQGVVDPEQKKAV